MVLTFVPGVCCRRNVAACSFRETGFLRWLSAELVAYEDVGVAFVVHIFVFRYLLICPGCESLNWDSGCVNFQGQP